jgi:hypothetical protein
MAGDRPHWRPSLVPVDLLAAIDREAQRIGVTRQGVHQDALGGCVTMRLRERRRPRRVSEARLDLEQQSKTHRVNSSVKESSDATGRAATRF